MAKVSKKAPAKTKQDRSAKPPELSPVYFLSLEVENVLCFKDRQVLDLTDKNGNPAQWTVILGDNGVGKTTLLRCLAGMESRKTLQIPRKNDTSEHIALPWVHSLQFAELWTAFLRQMMASSPISGHLEVNVCGGDKLSDSAQKRGNANSKKIICSGIGSGFSGSVKSSNTWESLGGLICYGYGAVRHLGETALDESLSSYNSMSLFSEKVSLINAEEWLLQTDYARRTAEGNVKDRLEKQLDQIFAILKHILPDVTDIRIATADEANPRPRAEFLTSDGWIQIDGLGLCYRTAIAWMVDLAVRLFRRYPNSPDPLAEPAIVLVDEIDLHLHPRWQRTIMDFLTERFPNTQFIVTAHSPLVVQAAQNANIVLLRREGDRVVIDNDPEIIKNWRVDQVLTSVFELPSSRPPHIEDLLKRHEEILAKAHLTQEDEVELEKLAAQIGPLPTAETLEDIEAMDIIRQAAKLLKNA